MTGVVRVLWASAAACSALSAATAETTLDREIYAHDVAPILAATCVSCHGPDKHKGGLRVDDLDHLLAGGTHGPVVIAGSSERSPLSLRIALAPDDDDVMPAEGAHLTPTQIATIAAWIDGGEASTGFTAPTTDLDVAAFGLDAVAEADLSPLVERGCWWRPISANHALIDLDCSQMKDAWDDGSRAAITALAPHVAWLDLSGTKTTDADLAVLLRMTRLRRLHLAHTAVTSAAIEAIVGLAQLEYLDLVGTAVDARAIALLTATPSLRALIVDPALAAAAREALGRRDIEINGERASAGETPR